MVQKCAFNGEKVNKVCTGNFCTALVFFHVFITVHGKIYLDTPSYLSAIVAGTWKVGRWSNHISKNSPKLPNSMNNHY